MRVRVLTAAAVCGVLGAGAAGVVLGHMYMFVAGVRSDTSARGQAGSRWINAATSIAGYVARHPRGL